MRRKLSIVTLVVAQLLVIGCASSTPQSDHLLSRVKDIPRAVEIPNVPFVDQSSGQCGPASLEMVLKSDGRNEIDLNTVTARVFTPGMRGSLQADMIGGSRRLGMMAVPISGMHALFQEIAAGHPVIVFENLALTWLPQWHYAVVYGYDFDREEVIMHSGHEANKHWDIRRFERSWKLADYWGLVVLPPGKLSVAASELEQMTAAAALEQVGEKKSAATAYQSILKRWPNSLGALVGLANLAYGEKNFQLSIRLLRRALAAHPSSTAVQHNLQVAESAQGANVQNN